VIVVVIVGLSVEAKSPVMVFPVSLRAESVVSV